LNEEQIIKAINTYTIDLYGKLKELGKNLFFSPFSIFITLLMVLVGARGKTKTQIKEALHITSEQASLHSEFKKLLRIFQNKGGSELYLANLMCVQEMCPPLDEYLWTLEDKYKGELWCLDFSDSKATCNRINSWVNQQTRGKIKKIIGTVTENTIFILLNAIYFKGKWFHQFKKKDTFIDPFKLISGEEVMVCMMFQKKYFRYIEEDGYKVLEMPYGGEISPQYLRGPPVRKPPVRSPPVKVTTQSPISNILGQTSMVVFLPNKKNGLTELENELTSDKIYENLSRMQNTQRRDVEVYFPRFKIETSYGLIKSHRELGITDAFNFNADLSGIIDNPPIYITDFIHKAYVEVNEKGTEAAAVTMMTAIPISAPPPKALEFRVDHPFLYPIIDLQTGIILFLGRVMKPEGSLPPPGSKPNRPPSLREELQKELGRIFHKLRK